MENSWSFSGRDSFFDRFSGGKYHTESDLENGMETENPGFFLSDPEFCGERYFRRSIFAGSVTTQGSTLSFSVFLWVYHIWGTAVSGLYADSWDGDRTYPDFIRAVIWYLRRCGRGRTSDSSVCDLYSGVFLSCWSCIQTVLWYLEKLWACTSEIEAIYPAGNDCISGVYRGNSCGKFPESVDSWKSCKGTEIF